MNIRLKSIEKHIVKKHGRARSLTPAEQDVLTFWLEILMAAIRNAWPVETGTSRDRWNAHAIPAFGDLGIVIENPMYYAEFVHRKGESGELWRSLVPNSWNAIKVLALAALRKKIDETEEKIAQIRQRTGRTLREVTLDFLRGVDLV